MTIVLLICDWIFPYNQKFLGTKFLYSKENFYILLFTNQVEHNLAVVSRVNSYLQSNTVQQVMPSLLLKVLYVKDLTLKEGWYVAHKTTLFFSLAAQTATTIFATPI